MIFNVYWYWQSSYLCIIYTYILMGKIWIRLDIHIVIKLENLFQSFLFFNFLMYFWLYQMLNALSSIDPSDFVFFLFFRYCSQLKNRLNGLYWSERERSLTANHLSFWRICLYGPCIFLLIISASSSAIFEEE